MEIISISCESCGAPIRITENIEQLYCSYCGTAFIVDRGEGYVALKLADVIGREIKESSAQTQSAIIEGANITQGELRRLQITQEISTATIQIGNIQSQIRHLQGQRQNRKTRKLIKELQESERNLQRKIEVYRETLEKKVRPSKKFSIKNKISIPNVKLGGSFVRPIIIFILVLSLISVLASAFSVEKSAGIRLLNSPLPFFVILFVALLFYSLSRRK